MSRGKSQKARKSQKRMPRRNTAKLRRNPMPPMTADALIDCAMTLAFGAIGSAIIRSLGIRPIDALIATGVAKVDDDKQKDSDELKRIYDTPEGVV